MSSRHAITVSIDLPEEHGTICGRLHLPDSDETCPAVLIIPGFADTAVGMHNMHVEFARELCRSGIAALRFDYRGLGESEGDFRRFTAVSGLKDAQAAMAFLQGHPAVDSKRIAAAGFSLGGAYAVMLANFFKLRALTLWSPVAYMEQVFGSFFKPEHQAEMESRGWADWMGWPVGRGFLDGLHVMVPLQAAASCLPPSIVLHGDNDQEVGLDNGKAYAALGAQLHVLAGGDHLYSSVHMQDTAIRKSTDWLVSKLQP